MASVIDREAQRALMEYLLDIYPDTTIEFYPHLQGKVSGESLTANLAYLSEHGLVETTIRRNMNGPNYPGPTKLTAQGVDFLADDGGLSAVLGVVTIKLHEDTLKQLLIDGVRQSGEPETVKDRLVDTIKGLPADATKLAVMEAAKAGLQQVPNLALWLGKLLGS